MSFHRLFPAGSRARYLQVVLILLAGVWVYWPALRGPWLWDDNLLISDNPLILDPAGLWKIWFAPNQLVDYFPGTVSVEWFEWRLWGLSTFGYHLDRLALHLCSALLVWRLLAKLGLRFAWLGGLIFAIHPVAVESVAWIAELKNTLSLPPFLLAMSAWIDWDRDRKRSDYFWALGLFLVAALCKSTVIMFPVVILLHAWWRRNRIGWSDLKASLPFFVVSLAVGIATLEFSHPVRGVPLAVELRPILAGLDIAFYFSKSLLPIGLLPVYPQWTVDPSSPAQWLPLPLLFAVLALCWIKRATWGRHALLGLGFFLINLAPFVGFNQSAYMGFTWVMDHVLYIPLIGIVGLFVAGMERIDGKLPRFIRVPAIGLVVLLVTFMAWGSNLYAAMYGNSLALWQHAFQGNPHSWIVRINFGEALGQRNRLDEAVEQFKGAAQLNPTRGEIYAQWGKADQQLGRLPEALDAYETSAKFSPEDSNLPYLVGNILVLLHRLPEAAGWYQKTLQANPNHGPAHYAMGCLLLVSNQIPEAIDHLQQSTQIDPTRAETHRALAQAFLKVKRLPEAIEQFAQAAQLEPNDVATRCSLGLALLETGRLREASDQFTVALQLDPNNIGAHYCLGSIDLATGKIPEAISEYQETLRLKPGFAAASANLARAQQMEKSAPTPSSPASP